MSNRVENWAKHGKWATRPARWLLATALAWVGTQTALADSKEAEKPAAPRWEVQRLKDLAYYSGPGADPIKHKLDLYVPKGKKDFPVVFFVHGGAWRHGDKSWLGVYSTLGLAWARHGVCTAVINYRLSPAVTHPEHIKDVARAFAWVHKNIRQYGGRPDEIFVTGHSAGGHLTALLATDERYLKAEGLGLAAIKGAIPMSGVYHIPEAERLFNGVFGPESTVHHDASPVFHARPNAPPFLIIYAEHDLPFCGRESSEEFCKALHDKKCFARTVEVKNRNHISLILNANTDGDPVQNALLDFVAEHAK
jgi:acetyl esterase/lipase